MPEDLPPSLPGAMSVFLPGSKALPPETPGSREPRSKGLLGRANTEDASVWRGEVRTGRGTTRTAVLIRRRIGPHTHLQVGGCYSYPCPDEAAMGTGVKGSAHGHTVVSAGQGCGQDSGQAI